MIPCDHGYPDPCLRSLSPPQGPPAEAVDHSLHPGQNEALPEIVTGQFSEVARHFFIRHGKDSQPILGK